MVVWGAHLPDSRYCTVGADNELGGYIATRHLIEQGRKRIAFLGDASLPEIGQRHRGYLRALSEAGLALDPRLDAPAHFTADNAAEAADRVLASGADPDGMFGASDVIAIEFIKALVRKGKSSPRDVSVVGFDDSSLAPHVSPPLTSVRQDLTLAAKHMIDCLFRRMEGEPAMGVQMTPELVVRGSSVP
jgi:DNA-binding LacI/PurR family transcriptional regulator